jgi:CRP/FNR family transcriptional regulator, cyclic AMP receptor protein
VVGFGLDEEAEVTVALADVPIFGGLSAGELALVGEMLEERHFEAGEVVVEEGSPGRELFVIARGEAEVLKGTTMLTTLRTPACFGEMALIGIVPRSATVRARTELTALVLPYQRVAALSESHPRTFTMIVMNLAREVCRRLQQTNAVLAEFGIRPRG